MSGICQRCGQCLSRCIYLRLTRDEAAIEMRRIDEGHRAPHIEAKCVSCYACNTYCPHDADPYGRIMKHFYGKYLAQGLPKRARYLMPTAKKSFRIDIVASLPSDEREMVAHWAQNEPRGEVLYPGCNLITSAYLTQSGVFDDLNICGSLEHCCGEMYFRMGLFDQARQAAEKVAAQYNGRGIKRMIVPCPAGYSMFTQIYPQRFGVKLDFPVVFVADYLQEQFDRGQLRVTRPLNRKVVMHDSCHARVIGNEMMDGVRSLLNRLGATPMEARYSREEGFCCGIAAGALRQSPTDIAKVALWAHSEYKKSAGEQIATYCTGCYLTLGMFALPAPVHLPVTHLLALTAEAIGCPVQDRLGARTRLMLKGVALNAIPYLLSRKRFYPAGK